MVIFHSYVSLPEGNPPKWWFEMIWCHKELYGSIGTSILIHHHIGLVSKCVKLWHWGILFYLAAGQGKLLASTFHLAAAQHHGCVLDNGALVGLCEHCSVCVLICTDGDLGTKNWVDFTRWKWLCISTKTTFLTVKLVKSTFLLVKTQILVVKPHFAVGGGWILFFGLCWKPSCRTFGCLSFGYPSRNKRSEKPWVFAARGDLQGAVCGRQHQCNWDHFSSPCGLDHTPLDDRADAELLMISRAGESETSFSNPATIIRCKEIPWMYLCNGFASSPEDGMFGPAFDSGSTVDYRKWSTNDGGMHRCGKRSSNLTWFQGPGGSAFWGMFLGDVFWGTHFFPGNLKTLDQICQVGQTNPIAVNLAAAPGSSAADGNSKSLSDSRHGNSRIRRGEAASESAPNPWRILRQGRNPDGIILWLVQEFF